VLVEGEPGMGKSRLLTEAARIARRLGFRVGVGAAEPGASVVELAPLMAALFDGPEPLLDRAELRDLHAAPAQPYWLLEDLEAMLERAALDAPVLVLLDDVHWADSGTAAALRALPARLAALPVAWTIAFRPHQGSSQVLNAIDTSSTIERRSSSSERSTTTPRRNSSRTSWRRSPTSRSSISRNEPEATPSS
jgi:predicted ATPase